MKTYRKLQSDPALKISSPLINSTQNSLQQLDVVVDMHLHLHVDVLCESVFNVTKLHGAARTHMRIQCKEGKLFMPQRRMATPCFVDTVKYFT